MKTNYSIQQMPENHEYPEMSYHFGDGEGYGIFQGNELVAYAWYTVYQSTESHTYMDIEMIEVIEKEERHGTNIIYFLFEHYQLERMNGSILFEDSMRPYYFWQSLGAELTATEDEYWDFYNEDLDITFDLLRSAVIKNESKQEELA